MTMTPLISRSVLIAAGIVASAQIGLVQAQQQQQRPREDNLWGGLAHQPTEEQVLRQEKAAGIVPPSQQQKAVNQSVEQIYQHLMTETAPGRATPP